MVDGVCACACFSSLAVEYASACTVQEARHAHTRTNSKLKSDT